MTAPRFAVCMCGHPKDDHPTDEVTGGACIGCDRCLLYRPRIGKAHQPDIVIPTSGGTVTVRGPGVVGATITSDVGRVATVSGPSAEQLIAAAGRSARRLTRTKAIRIARELGELRLQLSEERTQAEEAAKRKREAEEMAAQVAAARKVYTDALAAARAAKGERPKRPLKPCPVCTKPFGNVGLHRSQSAACAITEENPA